MVTSTDQPTNQQGEYRAICLFRKLENRKKAEICNFILLKFSQTNTAKHQFHLQLKTLELRVSSASIFIIPCQATNEKEEECFNASPKQRSQIVWTWARIEKRPSALLRVHVPLHLDLDLDLEQPRLARTNTRCSTLSAHVSSPRILQAHAHACVCAQTPFSGWCVAPTPHPHISGTHTYVLAQGVLLLLGRTSDKRTRPFPVCLVNPGETRGHTNGMPQTWPRFPFIGFSIISKACAC